MPLVLTALERTHLPSFFLQHSFLNILYPTKDIKEEALPNCDMKLWRRWNTALCVLIGGNTVRDHSIFFALCLLFLIFFFSEFLEERC